MKTPLQILAELLDPQAEAPADAHAVRAAVRAAARKPRAQEVAEYLIAASDGTLGRRGAGGSLKHILWWLNDYAGPEVGEAAAHEVLRAAVMGNWPLENALPHVRHGKLLGIFAEALAEGTDSSALAHYLKLYVLGSYRLAIYTGLLRLNKVAFQAGYDAYVAVSERGAVIHARRGLRVDGSRFPGWKQVYPELLIWAGVGNPPPVDEIAPQAGQALSPHPASIPRK
jgi:hypothetical protein